MTAGQAPWGRLFMANRTARSAKPHRGDMFIARSTARPAKPHRGGMFVANRTARSAKEHIPHPCRSYGAWPGIRGGRGYKHGAPNGATLVGRRRALAQHHPETRGRARFGLRPSGFELRI